MSSLTTISPALVAMPRKDNPRINDYFTHNRVAQLMAHTTRYAFKSETRLARDAGVSKSAVSRLVQGHTSPSFALVTAITRALEKALGVPLDPREVVSTDGTYPTSSVCDLVGCRRCGLYEVHAKSEPVVPVFSINSQDLSPPANRKKS